VLALPPRGCINVHASILPKYRGAAPINRAILNGEKETGVTIMHMAVGMDTGDIISTRTTPIDPAEDAAALSARLAELGAALLADTLPAIADGTAQRTPQDETQATYAAKLSRELSPVDWCRTSRQILDQIRGLIPWPCAEAELDGKPLKLLRAEQGGPTDDAPGTMRAAKRGIAVACGDGQSVLVAEVQQEGGKRMSAAAFLNGRRAASGQRIN